MKKNSFVYEKCDLYSKIMVQYTMVQAIKI